MGDLVRAIAFDSRKAQREANLPGSVFFTDPGQGRVSAMWFLCPCGCGLVQRITVGIGFKPVLSTPTWNWNGSIMAPTLDPSVNIPKTTICPGWHGWLRGGYWEEC
ncbi:DUF6527 family protein [Tropicibacter sp. S64]|uniref:DUF6527 family protein n=1 Tax=Tropicibacter sp. S64 TaxID=3415122 RepID=UPI003C7CFDB1